MNFAGIARIKQCQVDVKNMDSKAVHQANEANLMNSIQRVSDELALSPSQPQQKHLELPNCWLTLIDWNVEKERKKERREIGKSKFQKAVQEYENRRLLLCIIILRRISLWNTLNLLTFICSLVWSCFMAYQP